jgi:hypothetical protein
MAVVPADIVGLVKTFKALSDSLPLTVGTATREDKIYTTLVKVNEGENYMTFNRIFDILFKEDNDCRVDGRLRYLLRGKYGMEKLCAYLNDIDWTEPNLPLNLVKLKLDRVIEELVFLTCIKILGAKKSLCHINSLILYRKDGNITSRASKPKPLAKPKPAAKAGVSAVDKSKPKDP